MTFLKIITGKLFVEIKFQDIKNKKVTNNSQACQTIFTRLIRWNYQNLKSVSFSKYLTSLP